MYSAAAGKSGKLRIDILLMRLQLEAQLPLELQTSGLRTSAASRDIVESRQSSTSRVF